MTPEETIEALRESDDEKSLVSATVPTPPEPFTLPVVRCPACSHGINPHKGWGGACGVGDEQANPCPCMWTPNDIAAWHAPEGTSQKLRDAKAAIERVRALHKVCTEIPFDEGGCEPGDCDEPVCMHDDQAWPCLTIRALEEGKQ